jgi:RNA polymerase sigma-70 factor (ECF subfamily)
VEDAGIPDLTADVFSNILGRQVLSKVMALPEALRVTVVLVYLEGFKYAEAAEILDIPIGTVMSRLSSARKALQADLADKKEASE